jgi:hypothetical protein
MNRLYLSLGIFLAQKDAQKIAKGPEGFGDMVDTVLMVMWERANKSLNPN